MLKIMEEIACIPQKSIDLDTDHWHQKCSQKDSINCYIFKLKDHM